MTTLDVQTGLDGAGRLGFPLYDADEHYYEAVDAWTRHLPREYRSVVRWAQISGRPRLLVGDRLFTMNPDPTFATVGAPGVFEQYFRSNNPRGEELRDLVGDLQTLQPEYRDREARLRTLDGQGVAATLLFPTAGVGMEQMLRDRPADLFALIGAFNRWLEEDWGFDHAGRLFAAPLLSLLDETRAVAELERVRDAGARLVVLIPGPVASGNVSYSPGDPRFDRFWATAADAGILVTYHTGDSGYGWLGEKWGEGGFTGIQTSPFPEIMQLHVERPIQETLAALVGHGVFDRHPTLRVATIEAGSTWVLDLMRRMRNAYGKIPQKFAHDPVRSFTDHVWVAPFYEDDLVALRDVLGIGHMLFGSDWPHPEGLHAPADFATDLEVFSAAERRAVMSDNLRNLLAL